MENSPLAKLAPELRNQIYDLVFSDPGRVDVSIIPVQPPLEPKPKETSRKRLANKIKKRLPLSRFKRKFTPPEPDTKPLTESIYAQTLRPAIARTCKQIYKETRGYEYIVAADMPYRFYAHVFHGPKELFPETPSLNAERPSAQPIHEFEEYHQAWLAVFDKWYLNLYRPSLIEIDLGKWSMKTDSAADGYQIRPFRRIALLPREVCYSFSIDYTKAREDFQIQRFTIPAQDLSKALRVVESIIEDKKLQIERAFADGSEYINCEGVQLDLQNCRKLLRAFVMANVLPVWTSWRNREYNS